MTALITPPTLTESTSLDLLQNLQKVAISIPLSTASLGTAETKTILTSYVKQGQAKPPILLLHGFDSSVLEFRRLLPQLADHRQTWAIDLLGLANPPLAARWMFPPLDRWATNFLANPQIRQRISRAAYHDPTFASVDAQTCTSLHLNCDRWRESKI